MSGDVSGVNVGAIPSGFSPTSVLLCQIDRDSTAAGDAAGYTVTTNEAPMTNDLLGALELPDQVFWFDSRGACTAAAEAPLDLLLLDVQRHGMRPALPIGPCGKIRPEVREALAAAPMVVTDRRTI